MTGSTNKHIREMKKKRRRQAASAAVEGVITLWRLAEARICHHGRHIQIGADPNDTV